LGACENPVLATKSKPKQRVKTVALDKLIFENNGMVFSCMKSFFIHKLT